jgi:hypothetical protein
MQGTITRIAVTYTVDTLDGPRHTFHGLPHMREHIRPDQLQAFLDDLTAICEELVASRPATAANGLACIQRLRKGQLTSEDATALFQLRCRWQDIYTVALRDGTWSAWRLDNPASILTADTAPELRELLREDNAAQQRP